ncbi:MAG TPA: M20/M25/M40 family metallo-hydrolase [Gaiellaceae bacterium]|jgi:metal-dependent amidase/aminoacylase/carboxypeptidase family protein|nr:M20/M25/M40 family metallo-hydrolase [Gaiellaceae bacterium]
MIPDADLLAAVETRQADAVNVMRFVHGHPELGHEEHECSRFVAERLESAGFTVERGACGMETAFRAALDGGSGPGKTVGLVCLYDAVPAVRPDGTIEPVHSCGHGPIAGGVTAAALALADHRESLSGRVVVVGCPADEIHAPAAAERGGGKALSAASGLWDDVDAALYAHPEFIDTVSLQSRWMQRLRLLMSGNRSLSGDPEPPLQAASAVLAANELDVMVERVHLDGDVEEGTGLAVRADVLVFADSESELKARAAAVKDRVHRGEWTEGRVVQGVRPADEVRSAVASAFAAAGRSFVPDPPPLPFATDFGNISHRVPAALIGVGRQEGWKFHTDEGAAEFASDAGVDAAMTIARVLALSAIRLGA